MCSEVGSARLLKSAGYLDEALTYTNGHAIDFVYENGCAPESGKATNCVNEARVTDGEPVSGDVARLRNDSDSTCPSPGATPSSREADGNAESPDSESDRWSAPTLEDESEMNRREDAAPAERVRESEKNRHLRLRRLLQRAETRQIKVAEETTMPLRIETYYDESECDPTNPPKKNKAVHWSPTNEVITCNDGMLTNGYETAMNGKADHESLFIDTESGNNGLMAVFSSDGSSASPQSTSPVEFSAEPLYRVSPSGDVEENLLSPPLPVVTRSRGVVRDAESRSLQRACVKVDAFPLRLYASTPCLTVVAAVSTPSTLRCQFLFVDDTTSKSADSPTSRSESRGSAHASAASKRQKFRQPKYLYFSAPRSCLVASSDDEEERDMMTEMASASFREPPSTAKAPPVKPLLHLGVNVDLRAKQLQQQLRSAAKPPIGRPPVAPSSRSLSNGIKASAATCSPDGEDLVERITAYRKASQQSKVKPPLPPQHSSARLSGGVRTRVAAARRHFFTTQQESPARGVQQDPDESLSRLEALRAWAREERARLASSTPDLAEVELHVRARRRPSIDGPHEETASVPHRTASSRKAVAWPELGERLRRAQEQRERSLSLGYLETDIDTLVCRKVQETDLDKTTSMLTLSDRRTSDEPLVDNRARSADFLAEPDGAVERTKSELELRIERSLQNLHLPDWYTRSPPAKEGFILGRRRRSAGWQGFCSSRASSTSNLTVTSLSGRNVVIPKRMYTSDWLQAGWLRSSRDSLASSRSNADSQWSSSRLSAENVPLASSAFYRSLRKPYLGWRAAASCATSPAPSSPFPGSRPSSPREPSVGSADWQFSMCWDTSPREAPSDASSSRFSYVQSIYNSEQQNNLRPSWNPPAPQPAEPRSQLVWMESSFVGANNDPTAPREGTIEHVAVEDPSSCSYGNGDYLASADSSIRSYEMPKELPSPPHQVTSMEDVLDSLLAIPSPSRSPSPLNPWKYSISPSPSSRGVTHMSATQNSLSHAGQDSAPVRPVTPQPQDRTSTLFDDDFVKGDTVRLNGLLREHQDTNEGEFRTSHRGHSAVTIAAAASAHSDETRPPSLNKYCTEDSQHGTISALFVRSTSSQSDACFVSVTFAPSSSSHPSTSSGYESAVQGSESIEELVPLIHESESLSSAEFMSTNRPSQSTEHTAPRHTPIIRSATPLPTTRHEHDPPSTASSSSATCMPPPFSFTNQSPPRRAPSDKTYQAAESSPTVSLSRTAGQQDGMTHTTFSSEDSLDEKSPSDTPQPGTIVKCQYSKCNKSVPAEQAKTKFRQCPNCYTYYCSRHCRRVHWDRHKGQCPHILISALCKKVLVKAHDDPVARRHLSTCARRGYLAHGRGAVKLVFVNPKDASDFVENGWGTVLGHTFYVPRSELMPQEMGADVFSQIRVMCDNYNPDKKFVIMAAVYVTNEVALRGSQCMEREVVVRGAKMRLATLLPEDDVQTIILTVVKEPHGKGYGREVRQQGVSNILKQLEDRGVKLMEQFPVVHAKLLTFVDKGEPFPPLSLFPTDIHTGNMFMCIILPWPDGEIIQNISAKTSLEPRRRWIL